MPADQPKLWVRVVEAHAARTLVAVILAISAGLSLIILVAAGMYNTLANPEVTDLSSNYTAAISSTLGVLIGSLATYVGNSAISSPKNGGPAIRDNNITLDVVPPERGITDLT